MSLTCPVTHLGGGTKTEGRQLAHPIQGQSTFLKIQAETPFSQGRLTSSVK
jgi:hypothetical protein